MIKFFASRRPWDNRISLSIGHRTGPGAGGFSRAEPLLFKTVEPGEATIADAPTLSLEFDEAQVLMDELYSAGVRPTEGHGSVGQVSAMKEHLNDMRRLVFKDAPVDGKGSW